MSSMILNGDTSGAITVTVPSVAGTNTATLPAATGTVMVSGNMPAFSAYASSGTSVSNTTFTKIAFQTKEFDTASAYDNVTNYRFNPQVAGYYQITSTINVSNISASAVLIDLYKNGSEFKRGSAVSQVTGIGAYASSSWLVYLNGSTDYLEIYCYQTSGGTLTINTGAANTYFSGVLIRTA